nr:hypothetical protein [Tanacetum cinerariifolium]
AAVSPTAESPRYITESEPEMEPEDDDANDDGDDLSENDADDEDEEESSDSKEEEEEHLASTVPAPALADEKLIGRLRRERRYFRTVATTYAQEIEALRRDFSTLQRQHIEHAQRDVAPEDGDSCS